MNTKAKGDGGPLLVDLALQGGGAHGAFTWGVLDRLLKEADLEIEGISGTSAGAMNAAVLASGYMLAARPGAKAALEEFWRRVSWTAHAQPLSPHAARRHARPLDTRYVTGFHRLRSDVAHALAVRSQSARAPIRCATSWPTASISAQLVAAPRCRLFVTATNVHTGCGHVFRNAELTPDVLLASACLPMLFQAIEIDDEAYWDGGYSGNPTITPLVRDCTSSDTILVQVNPVERPGTPRSAREIIRPPQRGFVQRDAAERAAHDRAAAAGERSGRLRGRAVGRDAHPPHRECRS